jgi:hypothetical protein
MNRRVFISGLICIGVFGPAAAKAQSIRSSSAEISVFQGLADDLWSFLQSGLRLADIPNRRRLSRFLYVLNEPLTELLTEKYRLLTILEAGNCDNVTDYTRMAHSVAMIGNALKELRARSSMLASAIRPSGLEDDISDFADELGRVDADKIWMNRLPPSCPIQELERLALRAQVVRSYAVARQCQVLLNRIIRKLNSPSA